MKPTFLIPLAFAASSAFAMNAQTDGSSLSPQAGGSSLSVQAGSSSLSAQTGGNSITMTSTVDSLNNNKVSIEVRSVEVDGQMVTDTVSSITYTKADETETLDYKKAKPQNSANINIHMSEFDRVWLSRIWMITLPMLIILFPILIFALLLYSRYKNRQSRYRLIAKALESGQPLPKELQDEARKAFRQDGLQGDSLHQLRTKGISNVATGLGLFILLWALTGSFAIGCVGLLVLCIGLGKLANYYLQMKDIQGLRDQCAEKPSPEPQEVDAEEVQE